MMSVKELIEKLKTMPQDAKVWIQDADGSMGSSWTGWMACDAEAEDVRETSNGVLIARY
jgi:hypothetical protein